MIRKLIALSTLAVVFALFMSIPVGYAENVELIDVFKLTAQKFNQGKGKLTLDDGFALSGTKWTAYRDRDIAYGGSRVVAIYGQSIDNSAGSAGSWNFGGLCPFNDQTHVYSLQLGAPPMEEGYYSQFNFAGYLDSYKVSYELVQDEAIKNKFSGLPAESEAQCYKVVFSGSAPVYITYINRTYPTRGGGVNNTISFHVRSSLYEVPVAHFSFNDFKSWVGKQAFQLLGMLILKRFLLKQSARIERSS